MRSSELDPIIAIATASGRGGIGIVRVSGKGVPALIDAVCGRPLAPRHATHVAFLDAQGQAIDRGIAICFPGPQSYTGEDVLELQAHGGPVVLQMLLARCLEIGRTTGLRLAEPGEFTRRAYLNDKMDLAQAEAVADLIEASTEAAARSALRSLDGAFSRQVDSLVQALIRLRLLVEATLDFPEEEIEFLKDSDALGQLAGIQSELSRLLESTRQGALLRDGLSVVLAGRPNVGKSSLLNALAQAEVAIVTPIAGTTRDRVTQTVQIQGVALHVVDTAGLRYTNDAIERIGIERTWQEIERADIVLHLRDAADPDSSEDAEIAAQLPATATRRVVMNKIDLTGEPARLAGDAVYLSAHTGAGLDILRAEILAMAGWDASSETVFLGRQRHLEALAAARANLASASEHAHRSDRALDLFAEELRLAQDHLGEISGAFSSDDLLGEIFGRFCIGK